MSNLIYLSDICDFQGGTQPPKEQWSTSLKDGYVRMLQIRDFTQSEKAEPEYVRYSTNLKMCKSDDILIARYGASLGKILTGLSGAYNVAIMKTIPKENKITKSYLYYFLLSDSFQNMIKSFASRAAQAGFNKQDLSLIKLKCPSIEQQEEECIILNYVYNLIDKRKQQILLLDKLIKSRFIEMFGDPVKNEKKLPLEQLSKIGILERGKSQHRPRNAPELLGGPYPLIQTGDVSNSNIYITTYNNTYSELGLKQSKLWEPGTLCITIAANIAQTAILTFKACFPDSVVGFIPNNNTNVIFIHYWFRFFQKVLEEQAPQVAQKNINLKILSELKVILPPIELQNQFAAFVKQTDKSKFDN